MTGACSTVGTYARSIICTPLATTLSLVTGIGRQFNVEMAMAFLKNEAPPLEKVSTLPEALWKGLQEAYKTTSISVPSQDGVKAFFLENKVSLGLGAAWGVGHSVVDHIASRFFENRLYIRSTVTYALTGVAIWQAAQAAELDVSPEMMGNIALYSYMLTAAVTAVRWAPFVLSMGLIGGSNEQVGKEKKA